jgi:IMP dehydrogenase
MLKVIDGLTFDDVLLVPRYSEIRSRADIDLSVKLSKGLRVSHPIIPANMKTITEIDMVRAIYKTQGITLVHRFMPLTEQLDIARPFANDWNNYVGFSVGMKDYDKEAVDQFVKRGVKIICIDVAHGHTQLCINMTEWIAKKYPDVFLIAGAVATAEGAIALYEAGCDAVRVNVGAGSICSTRVETGNGVPQLTALSDCWDAKKNMERTLGKKLFVIGDGGMSQVGHCVLALCFSDLILTGNLVAGTDETPGELLTIDGRSYKSYVGSSTHKTNRVEGVAAIVPAKGPVKNVLTKIWEGIQSGLSYQGCTNLEQLKQNPRFVRLTNAGLKESGAHDVIVR